MASSPRAKRSRRSPQYAWDAAKVKALRDHLGLTQAEFAEELGTLQQTISQWECGYHYPKGLSAKMLTLVAEKAKFSYAASEQEDPS